MDNYKTTLETERLILRQPAIEDLEAFQAWCGNPENTRYMSFGPNTEEQTLEWLSYAKPGKDFAVLLKETGAVIGSCGIYPNDTNYMGDIGWILHKDYWKRGYGTELGGELIRYGFEDLNLGRIQAPCAAVNYGSYRVMERNGMRREALHRKAFWARVDKEWIDEAVYAILAEEYYAQKQYGENVASSRKHELHEALRAINSTIGKCEKAQLKLKVGTPQHTLTRRRLKAFYIAVSLIERELEES